MKILAKNHESMTFMMTIQHESLTQRKVNCGKASSEKVEFRVPSKCFIRMCAAYAFPLLCSSSRSYAAVVYLMDRFTRVVMLILSAVVLVSFVFMNEMIIF